MALMILLAVAFLLAVAVVASTLKIQAEPVRVRVDNTRRPRRRR